MIQQKATQKSTMKNLNVLWKFFVVQFGIEDYWLYSHNRQIVAGVKRKLKDILECEDFLLCSDML